MPRELATRHAWLPLQYTLLLEMSYIALLNLQENVFGVGCTRRELVNPTQWRRPQSCRPARLPRRRLHN